VSVAAGDGHRPSRAYSPSADGERSLNDLRPKPAVNEALTDCQTQQVATYNQNRAPVMGEALTIEARVAASGAAMERVAVIRLTGDRREAYRVLS